MLLVDIAQSTPNRFAHRMSDTLFFFQRPRHRRSGHAPSMARCRNGREGKNGPHAFREALPPDLRARPADRSRLAARDQARRYRMLAHRDSERGRLLSRRGLDWADRFPAVAAAVEALAVRSCTIDGEVIACRKDGLADFELLRYRRRDAPVTLVAFDLIELDGRNLRREPIETRRPTLRGFSTDVGRNSCSMPCSMRGVPSCSSTLAPSGARAS
jgi:ATP dependent DNA ligase domain